MQPQRVISDSKLALQTQKGVSVSIRLVCSPAMLAVPFTQTLIRLGFYLRCQLNGGTTPFPHSVFLPFIQNGEVE